jgi:hypothetical protein
MKIEYKNVYSHFVLTVYDPAKPTGGKSDNLMGKMFG